MKAVILAAGRGSRMGALTGDRPKCLTRIAGRTLLDWQRAALSAAGIRDHVVVRGYRGEMIAGEGYDTIDNPRWADSNMVVSLLAAAPVLESSNCIVSYADVVYHPTIVSALSAAPHPLAIAYDDSWELLWRDRFADPLADAESFRATGGRLTEIGARCTSLADIQGQYMGLLKFTPAGWRQMASVLERLPGETVDRLDMTALLRRLIEYGVEIGAIAVSGQWCEVDNADDVALYTRRLAMAERSGRGWSHDWRW
jgi:choline kinase